MRTRPYAVYILTTSKNTALYVGVTNNLERRLFEHRVSGRKGFTRRYAITKLVHVEWFEQIVPAIAREKQLKAGSRRRKVELITAGNPEWRELWP